MKKISTLSLLCIFLLVSIFSNAQVSDIKTASSNHSAGSGSSGRGEGGYSGNAFVFDLFFNVVFGEIIRAQQNQLERRHEVPAMISVEAMLQTAVQPSGYYLLHPRVRINWGLFSSDFRFNYLIEEGISEVTHIRTNDWQVLQLNLVSTRDVVFRVGGGILQETFSGEKTYGEWTAAIQVHPHTSRTGGLIEYRNSEARNEISAFAQYKLFDEGVAHGFATGGAVYQRYYSSIAVWGVQGGFLFKFY
jgi:hypothetical protein